MRHLGVFLGVFRLSPFPSNTVILSSQTRGRARSLGSEAVPRQLLSHRASAGFLCFLCLSESTGQVNEFLDFLFKTQNTVCVPDGAEKLLLRVPATFQFRGYGSHVH
ncbi:hypothetical protein C8F04DRAFT_1066166 [Mycena alexandri]|uniref:Uncharacterized protein n=1 Tax=Mycena alexandri TaxID=1745969 RepID=A0AAD6XB06_9AGAR|nr:hypothetical protein C8F04DRAFT_1066166 [Mycena alexandri]